MSDADASLEDQARSFSDKIGTLLTQCLPDAPSMRVSVVGGKVRIRPDGQTGEQGGVPLHVDGTPLAWLRINYSCRSDSTRKYLAVDTSKLWIVSTRDRSPLFRFEYNYDSRTAPHSHIQVHAERGTLSHLLTRTGHGRSHDMSALHLPTGGARFRPDLEDVVQFVITECGFDSLDGWQDAVDERRAEWRAIQTRAAVRAMASVAAAELRDAGYTVIPPADGEPHLGRKARYAW
ncbi:hypothetical protein BKA08_003077 [Nocardioides marinisabuli]|uniref:Uncharacterized protein n=1 Tax=Nocardioides marinisabuli TaxID=419476 RepID=A0A7Y9JTH5_9ACTN|nr:hypothetical protein [Nocardioides marinisabuli]NYD58839.1 hypothetical protein [Nocardioides marinisabuli]